MECQSKEMSDSTPYEDEALSAATAMAGEYIESIGKADLFQHFTGDEFDALIDTTIYTYHDALQKLTGGPKSQEAEAAKAQSTEAGLAMMSIWDAIGAVLDADLTGQGMNDQKHYRDGIQRPMDALRMALRRYRESTGEIAPVVDVGPAVLVAPRVAHPSLIDDDDIPFANPYRGKLSYLV
jgi:hypothetical protein